MRDDVFTPAERARYEGLLTAVALAYAKGRPDPTEGMEEFIAAVMELVGFALEIGWEKRVAA